MPPYTQVGPGAATLRFGSPQYPPLGTPGSPYEIRTAWPKPELTHVLTRIVKDYKRPTVAVQARPREHRSGRAALRHGPPDPDSDPEPAPLLAYGLRGVA